jgi:pyruvate,orthophosphate dikinase
VAQVEAAMGKKFGDVDNTLLFSVRSGAAMSMPGMMDTVLNVGLNDTVVQGLAKQVNERFAWDCYRRLLQVRLLRWVWGGGFGVHGRCVYACVD